MLKDQSIIWDSKLIVKVQLICSTQDQEITISTDNWEMLLILLG